MKKNDEINKEMENEINNAHQSEVIDYDFNQGLKPLNNDSTDCIKSEMTNMEVSVEGINNIDENFQKAIDKNWTTAEKIKDFKTYLQVQRLKRNLIDVSGEYRVKYIDNILRARLEGVQEMLDAGITMVKSHYREQVARFLLDKFQSLNEDVNVRKRNFFKAHQANYNFAETLRETPSYQRYYKTLEEDEVRFINFLNKLLINFENSIENIVKKYKS